MFSESYEFQSELMLNFNVQTIYFKSREMAPLLLKVKEVTIMPALLRRMMAITPHGEEGVHLLTLKRKVDIPYTCNGR